MRGTCCIQRVTSAILSLYRLLSSPGSHPCHPCITCMPASTPTPLPLTPPYFSYTAFPGQGHGHNTPPGPSYTPLPSWWPCTNAIEVSEHHLHPLVYEMGLLRPLHFLLRNEAGTPKPVQGKEKVKGATGQAPSKGCSYTTIHRLHVFWQEAPQTSRLAYLVLYNPISTCRLSEG